MRTDGAYTDGGAKNRREGLPPGPRARRLARFVEATQLAGNDEQYAATLALVGNGSASRHASSWGPSPPAGGDVRGRDVHAWVEVRHRRDVVPDAARTFVPTATRSRTSCSPRPRSRRSAPRCRRPQGSTRRACSRGRTRRRTPSTSRSPRRQPFDPAAWPWWLRVLLLLRRAAAARAGRALLADPRAPRPGVGGGTPTRGTDTARVAWAWDDLVESARSFGTPCPTGHPARAGWRPRPAAARQSLAPGPMVHLRTGYPRGRRTPRPTGRATNGARGDLRGQLRLLATTCAPTSTHARCSPVGPSTPGRAADVALVRCPDQEGRRLVKLKFTLRGPVTPTPTSVATVDGTTTVGQLAEYLVPRRPVTRERRLGPGGPGRLHALPRRRGLPCRGPARDHRRERPAVRRPRGGHPPHEGYADRGQSVATAVVVAGPDIGQGGPARRGHGILGRGRGCEVQLSRRAGVAPPRATARDRHRRGDRPRLVQRHPGAGPAGRPAILKSGDRFRIGDTEIEIGSPAARPGSRRPRGAPRCRSRARRGSHPLCRPRVPLPPCRNGPKPERPPWIAAMVPLLLGVALPWRSREPPVRCSSCCSRPGCCSATTASRGARPAGLRGTRSRSSARTSASWSTSCSEEQEREVVGRRAEHPARGEAADAVGAASTLLWTRRPGDPGFSEFRLGLGPLPSRNTLKIPELGRSRAEAWLEASQAATAWVRCSRCPSSASRCAAVPSASPAPAAAPSRRPGPSSSRPSRCTHPPTWWWPPSVPRPPPATGTARVGAPHGLAAQPHRARHLAHRARLPSLVAEVEEIIPTSTRPVRGGRRQRPVQGDFSRHGCRRVGRSSCSSSRTTRPSSGAGWSSWPSAAGATASSCCGCRPPRRRCPRPAAPSSSRGRSRAMPSSATSARRWCACRWTPTTSRHPRSSDCSRQLAPLVDSGVPVEDESDLPRSVSFLTLVGQELAEAPGPGHRALGENRSILTGPYAAGRCARPKPGNLRAVVGQSAARDLLDRPARRRPARPGRRHHRRGQERAAADLDPGHGRRAHPRSGSTSCSSTTRAARPSATASTCRTRSAWSPTSARTWSGGRSTSLRAELRAPRAHPRPAQGQGPARARAPRRRRTPRPAWSSSSTSSPPW